MPITSERGGITVPGETSAHAVHHDGADAYQTAALDIAAVQRNVVPDGHLVFEYGRVRAVRDMYDRPVLHVRAVANSYVEHVAAHDRAEPDGRLLANHNIA